MVLKVSIGYPWNSDWKGAQRGFRSFAQRLETTFHLIQNSSNYKSLHDLSPMLPPLSLCLHLLFPSFTAPRSLNPPTMRLLKTFFLLLLCLETSCHRFWNTLHLHFFLALFKSSPEWTSLINLYKVVFNLL